MGLVGAGTWSMIAFMITLISLWFLDFKSSTEDTAHPSYKKINVKKNVLFIYINFVYSSRTEKYFVIEHRIIDFKVTHEIKNFIYNFFRSGSRSIDFIDNYYRFNTLFDSFLKHISGLGHRSFGGTH